MSERAVGRSVRPLQGLSAIRAVSVPRSLIRPREAHDFTVYTNEERCGVSASAASVLTCRKPPSHDIRGVMTMGEEGPPDWPMFRRLTGSRAPPPPASWGRSGGTRERGLGKVVETAVAVGGRGPASSSGPGLCAFPVGLARSDDGDRDEAVRVRDRLRVLRRIAFGIAGRAIPSVSEVCAQTRPEAFGDPVQLDDDLGGRLVLNRPEFPGGSRL